MALAIAGCGACWQGAHGGEIDPATDRVLHAAIESPVLLGQWLMKPQYAVSRDGARVVYAIEAQSIAARGFTLALWTKDLAHDAPPRLLADLHGSAGSGLQISRSPGPPVNPSLSPDGSKVALVGYGPAADLALIELASGKVKILHPHLPGSAQPAALRCQDVAWSPDGRKLAVSYAEVRPGSDAVGTEISVDWNGSLATALSRLGVIDLESGTMYAQTPDSLDVLGTAGAFSWSPDSEHLAFSARRIADSAYDFRSVDIFELDIASQQVRPLVAQAGIDVDPRWSPDGRYIAFLSQGGNASLRGIGVGLYSPADGTTRYLPQSDPKEQDAYALTWYDSTHVLYTGLRRMGCPLFSGSVSGKVRQISPDDLSCVGGALPGARGEIIFGSHSFASSAALMRSSLSRWQPTLIAPDAPRGLPPARQQVLSWRSADGRFTVHGILITPEDGHVGPRPLLVTIDGGPDMVTSSLYDASAQQPIYPALLRGFAVLAPNTRGRQGYDDAFADAIRQYHDFTPGPFSDIMSGVDHVVNDLHLADPAHMALMGFSYGATLVSYAASHTDRFKALIAGEGTADLRDFATQAYGSIEQTTEDRIMGIGDPYDPDEARIFAAQSPILQPVEDINTPLLIECGELSLAHTQCLKFFRLLRKKSPAPVTMVVYPHSGHGLIAPSLRYDSAVRETRWLDRWVLGIATAEPAR